jgi:predicted HicB family RNase H-like nuclease
MRYKGYTASVQHNEEEKCLIGEVIGIDHIIFFRGATSEEIYETFKEMIDEYLEDCAEEGIEPNKPPTEIMVAISTDLYAKASHKANLKGLTVDGLINHAVENLVSETV